VTVCSCPACRSPADNNWTRHSLWSALHPQVLLGGEVKVESILEPVQLELARGEEVFGCWGGRGSELLGLLEGVPGCLGGSWGICTRVPVRVVIGVDEGVDTSTIGTGRHTSTAPQVCSSIVSGVGVVSEVVVGWVMGVDEWVGISIDSRTRSRGKALLRCRGKVLFDRGRVLHEVVGRSHKVVVVGPGAVKVFVVIV